MGDGFQFKDYPCMWCGAATGIAPPPTDIVCFQQGGHVRRNPEVRCPKHETTETVLIGKHLVDETCCQGAGSVN